MTLTLGGQINQIWPNAGAGAGAVGEDYGLEAQIIREETIAANVGVRGLVSVPHPGEPPALVAALHWLNKSQNCKEDKSP